MSTRVDAQRLLFFEIGNLDKAGLGGLVKNGMILLDQTARNVISSRCIALKRDRDRHFAKCWKIFHHMGFGKAAEMDMLIERIYRMVRSLDTPLRQQNFAQFYSDYLRKIAGGLDPY